MSVRSQGINRGAGPNAKPRHQILRRFGQDVDEGHVGLLGDESFDDCGADA